MQVEILIFDNKFFHDFVTFNTGLLLMLLLLSS